MSNGGRFDSSLSVSDFKLEILSLLVGLQDAWLEGCFCEAGGLVPDTEVLVGRSEVGQSEICQKTDAWKQRSRFWANL